MNNGFFVNDRINALRACKYLENTYFCCGLKAFDVTGKSFDIPTVVLDSLNAPLTAINSDGYVPVNLGSDAGSVWMHNELFEITSKAEVSRNMVPLTDSWVLCFGKPECCINQPAG